MTNENLKFVVIIKDKKTGKVVETIGKEGMTSNQSLRVLGGVRINLDNKNYLATTELFTTNQKRND